MKKRMCELGVGESALIDDNFAQADLRRRLLDIGVVSGEVVGCVGRSPFGDPTAYLIKGAVIAIRKSDSSKIIVVTKTP